MKKVFTFFLTLFVASSVWAYDFVVDGIYYDIDEELNSSVSVVDKYNNYEGSITIPSSVTYDGKTYNVTSIGDSAFYNCSGMTSVTIPNSVTSIGDEAFRGCSGLTSVTIPNGVTSIGNDAFYGCSGLTSLTIPESLDVSDAGIYFTKEGIRHHVLDGKEVEVASNSYTGDIIIPSSVTAGNTYSVSSIEYDAFSGCSGLNSVTIGNSVTSIGDEAFRGCSGLTSVTIPESLGVYNAEIYFTKEGIRYHVPNGKEVEVAPNSYTGNIVIPSSITAGNTFSVTSIGNKAFYGCSGLTSVTIGNSVTSIGARAFEGCEKLLSVNLPSSIGFIHEYAFRGCIRLAEITCMAQITPTTYENSFANYNGYLLLVSDKTFF